MAERYMAINAELIEYLDDEEAEALKAVLVHMMMECTDMDAETIYSLIFKDGARIIWH